MRESGFFRGLAFGIAFAVAVGLAGTFLLNAQNNESAQSQTSTQPYSQSRYALLNGPVLTVSQDTSPVVQNALFRIDTYTGEVWVLQLQIQTQNNPVISSATFIPATIQTTPPAQPNPNAMSGTILEP